MNGLNYFIKKVTIFDGSLFFVIISLYFFRLQSESNQNLNSSVLKHESPRIALVHDWLTGMRGGEKILEVFCELFPDATIFTLLHNEGAMSPTIEQMKIKTSFHPALADEGDKVS